MGRGTKAAICVKGDSSKHPYMIILYLVHSTDESKLEIFFHWSDSAEGKSDPQDLDGPVGVPEKPKAGPCHVVPSHRIELALAGKIRFSYFSMYSSHRTFSPIGKTCSTQPLKLPSDKYCKANATKLAPYQIYVLIRLCILASRGFFFKCARVETFYIKTLNHDQRPLGLHVVGINLRDEFCRFLDFSYFSLIYSCNRPK